MHSSATAPRTFRELARPGWNAVVENRRPFMTIQALAVLAAAAYYCFPAVQPALRVVADFKVRAGLPFAAAATAFAGVVLPEVARSITRHKSSTAGDLGFQAVLYAIVGSTVDLLYRGLAILLGSGLSFWLVAEKILIDQLVYSPLVSIPFSTLMFLWRDEGFGSRGTFAAIRQGEFARRYTPLLITCWGFWAPVLVAVYALPPDLQFLMFLCAQGAWSLLLVTVAKGE